MLLLPLLLLPPSPIRLSSALLCSRTSMGPSSSPLPPPACPCRDSTKYSMTVSVDATRPAS